MKRNRSFGLWICVLIASLLNLQCHDDGGCGTVIYKDLPFEHEFVGINTIADLNVQKLNKDRHILMLDSLAEDAYDRIDKILREDREVRLNTYIIQKRDEIIELAGRRGFKTVIFDDGEYIATKDDWECVWNKNSYYEECHNIKLFHSTDGVDESELNDDDFYIDAAWRIVEDQIHPSVSEHFQYYLYKMKRLMITTSGTDDEQNAIDKVEHVGVGFASTLDGWPVIGFGGKIGVYMMPDGSSVSETIYRIEPVIDQIKDVADIESSVITEKDLKSPQEALEELSQTENIDLSDYSILRKEFGYMTFGKTNVQNVLAPYYVFFLQSMNKSSNLLSDGSVEIFEVLAIKGDKASVALEDAMRENKRMNDELNNIEQQWNELNEEEDG